MEPEKESANFNRKQWNYWRDVCLLIRLELAKLSVRSIVVVPHAHMWWCSLSGVGGTINHEATEKHFFTSPSVCVRYNFFTVWHRLTKLPVADINCFVSGGFSPRRYGGCMLCHSERRDLIWPGVRSSSTLRGRNKKKLLPCSFGAGGRP